MHLEQNPCLHLWKNFKDFNKKFQKSYSPYPQLKFLQNFKKYWQSHLEFYYIRDQRTLNSLFIWYRNYLLTPN